MLLNRLQSLETWRDSLCVQPGSSQCTDNAEEYRLEYHNLELRVHPPNVTFADDAQGRTTITIDSANRPNTLVEVVQGLTEGGFNVCSARISSDGGWFFDEFTTTEKIQCKRKQEQIKRLLGAEITPYDHHAVEETVFQLAGPDRPGLLADVLCQLKVHGCTVQTAAVWTSNGRVAFVLSVSDAGTATNGHAAGGNNAALSLSSAHSSSMSCDLLASRAGSPGVPGHAVKDLAKLERLTSLLERMMTGGKQGGVMHVVEVVHVRGPVHYERRLHELLSRMEEADWEESDLRAHYESMVGNGQGELPLWDRPPSPAQQDGNGYAHLSVTSPRMALLERTASAGSGVPASSAPNSTLHLQTHSCLLPGLHMSAEGFSGLGLTSAGQLSALAGGSTGSHPSASTAAWLTSLSLTGTPATSQTAPRGKAQSGNGSVSSANTVGGTGGGSHGGGMAMVTGGGVPLVSPKFSKPQVTVRHNTRLKYWLVDIRCKDRKKLFFDTVCTLASLEFDIFHASVDVEGTDTAHQIYYVRRRTGDATWSQSLAAKLCYLLEASIQRRFPKGVKMRIQSWQPYDLLALATSWRDAGLLITRAKVRPCLSSSSSSAAAAAGTRPAVSNTFYLLDASTGTAPDPTVVQQACVALGGVSMGVGSANSSPAPGTVAPPSQPAPAVSITFVHSMLGVGSSARPPRPPSSLAGGSVTAGSTGSLDYVRERCPHATFGFQLLHRGGMAGSPGSFSIASSS